MYYCKLYRILYSHTGILSLSTEAGSAPTARPVKFSQNQCPGCLPLRTRSYKAVYEILHKFLHYISCKQVP